MNQIEEEIKKQFYYLEHDFRTFKNTNSDDDLFYKDQDRWCGIMSSLWCKIIIKYASLFRDTGKDTLYKVFLENTINKEAKNWSDEEIDKKRKFDKNSDKILDLRNDMAHILYQEDENIKNKSYNFLLEDHIKTLNEMVESFNFYCDKLKFVGTGPKAEKINKRI